MKFQGGRRMSNNSDVVEATPRRIPRLRFPEFLDKPEWGTKRIGEFAKVTTGNKDTQNKVDGGEYPFFVRSQNVERINSFSYDGEAILTSGDGVGVGKNFHYINGKFDFHQRVYSIYDFSKDVSGRFFFRYFTEHFNKRVMQLSAKNSVDSVRMSMITEMPVQLPNWDEQNKVANCLSSLDDLINAESSKLESLRIHKTGLMQQLFPAEGGSTPLLRFTELVNTGDWNEVQLSQIASAVKLKNKNQEKSVVLSLSSEHGLVSQTDYFLKKIAGENTEKYIKIQENDFVYNDRVTKSSKYGTIKRLSKYTAGIVSPIYKCFRFNEDQNPIFWQWYFESKSHETQLNSIINEGARAGRFNISIDNFLSTIVFQPLSNEQQKIADCLSSLDDLVTAQEAYISTLNQQKKGLMQQLFPSSDEAAE